MIKFELYQGEELLGIGSAIELSEKLNINKASIYNFASEAFHNRADNYSNQKIAFTSGRRKTKVKKIKSALDEKLDLIVQLYFKGYDLKTILKTMEVIK